MMTTDDGDEENGAPLPGGTEAKVSHFIPSVELTGSRADKLEKLDTLIVYLERLRRSLAGETPGSRGGYEGPSRHLNSRAWPWFSAGAGAGGLFVVLLLLAKSCA
jgi:hypothetical protein